MWEHIPKNIFVTLPNLEFGVYHAAVHFDRMKASVSIYEKLNFAPGVDMLKVCKKRNLKRVSLANQRARLKNKLRRQILRAKKISKNDKLLEKERHLYVPGGFYIYSSIIMSCNILL